MPKTVFTGAHAVLVETLRSLRVKAGLTQAEVADKIKRDQSFVSLIEGGQRRVDTLEFIGLCRALGADPVEVMADLVRQLPGDIEM